MFSTYLDRRTFLMRLAVFGLTGTALSVFLQACKAQLNIPSQNVNVRSSGMPLPSQVNGKKIPPSIPTSSTDFSQNALANQSVDQNQSVLLSDHNDPPPVLQEQELTNTENSNIVNRSTVLANSNSLTHRVVLKDERIKINHLLRRAGFGGTPSEVDHYLEIGLEETIEYLLNYERIDDTVLESKLAALNLDVENKPNDLQRWWLLRMLYTRRPLLEKMVLFWHGIYTSALSKVSEHYMYNQNQLFRKHAFGSFELLLKDVSRDPAMLVWLDSRRNKKSAPNENFSRELMELFSIGEGNYTETDVRESARAFTGYFLTRDGFTFRTSQHDFGIKDFMGKSGTFQGDDIIDIILEQDATGEYISRRLFEFFVHDHPTPTVVQEFAKVFRSSHYSVRALMRYLLQSEEFYSAEAYRNKIKSPVELVIGTLRSLGAETDGKTLPRTISQMGQTLFDPPDVSGWAEGLAWINSSTLLGRINFARSITKDNAKGTSIDWGQGSVSFDEMNPTDRATIKYFSNVFLDGRIDTDHQKILDAYVDHFNEETSLNTLDVSSQEHLIRSVAYLVMASPDYQLA